MWVAKNGALQNLMFEKKKKIKILNVSYLQIIEEKGVPEKKNF